MKILDIILISFVANFEHISYIILVVLLQKLNNLQPLMVRFKGFVQIY